MRKKTALLSALSVGFCVAAATAEAKLVRYEINGQSYSYSTNNRQQTKEARERIAAAAAAEAAKARAQAEAAANPLARIFGSPAQREATQAQARVQQVLAGEAQPDVASTSSVGHVRAERRSGRRATTRRERRQATREARLHKQAPVRGSESLPARRVKAEPTDKSVGELPAAPRQLPNPTTTSSVSVAPPAPSLDSPRAPVPTQAGGGSLADFVNQVRKAPPADAPPGR